MKRKSKFADRICMLLVENNGSVVVGTPDKENVLDVEDGDVVAIYRLESVKVFRSVCRLEALKGRK